MAEPSGRRRHRIQKWTGLLVLQIEMAGDRGRGSGYETWWIDARPEHLLPVEGSAAPRPNPPPLPPSRDD